MKAKGTFFNNPWKPSFKDLLAIVFIGSFLYFCWNAQHAKQALELVKTLIPPVVTILGGYFGQEIAAMYVGRSQGFSSYGSYYGSGYSSYGVMDVTASTDTMATQVSTADQGEAGPV